MVKGMLGVASLILPLLWSTFEMLLLAQVSVLGRVALGFLFMVFFYSNGENLEILAYLFWPGLLILGAAHREASLRAPLPQPVLKLASA